jgi:multidrug efflux pump subunit AcrA (membrane-fusion protein)
MNFLKKMKEKFSDYLWRTNDKIGFYINENLRTKLTSFINNLIPDKDITKTSILFYFIAIFCVLSIIWGFSARIDMVVRATGEVIPATRVKVIQSVFPGVIEKINIKLGDEVKKGDVLFVIDGVRTNAEYESNERAYEAALLEVQTYQRKTDLIEDLVNQGAESEMRLLDERLRLVDSQKRLYQVENNRLALRQQKEQTQISAPYDGFINDIYITTVGGVVQTAETLANLVPADEKLVIRALVAPSDVSFIKTGQKAKISFSAYDVGVYGSFEGVIAEIGVTTTKQDENVYYETRIEVTDENINNINVKSGMEVEVNVIGQKRTVFGYVFSPVTKLKRRAFREK